MTKDIKISFIDRKFTRTVNWPLVAGDKSVYNLILDCGKYPDAKELFVYAVRSDGSVVVEQTFIDGSEFTYTLKENMYSIEGEMTLRLVLSDGGEKILTACELKFDVLPCLLGTDAASDSNVSLAEIYLELHRKVDKTEMTAYAKADELDEVENELGEKAGLTDLTELIPRTTVNGSPIFLTDHLECVAAKDYKLYGNCVQDGTPTAEAPIDVLSVGDLTDSGYAVPITVRGKNLFDKGNVRVYAGYISNETKLLTSQSECKTIYIECEPNTAYTVSRDTSYQQFIVGCISEEAKTGVAVDCVVN
ncbi:MAG: hypothetical protein IJ366_08380, partial [Clostridia bacterium]|nr:hypothetical protein [Clostridia bacterium]